MSVTVLTGRSGSGKSRVLMKLIAGFIKDPFSKVIVIVPGQLTFETEKNIMEQCRVKGILGLEVMSVQRLAFKVLEDAGSVAFISNAQKALYLSRALEGEAFGDISGLEDCTAALMTRLKSYCQTPESLRAAAEGLKDGELKKKLLNIALVYERYIKLCGGSPDVSDMYAMAAAAAPRAEFLRGAHVIIDGIDSASPAVLDFLAEVIYLSKDVTAAFRSGSEEEGDLFYSEQEDMRRFIEAAKKSGKAVTIRSVAEAGRYDCAELAYLEANLYRYPYKPYGGEVNGIILLQAQSLEAEVEMIASGILKEIKEGRRFRDIAIAVGGIDAYLPAIKAKFTECNIPYFYDERRTLADNTFFEFLHDALAAAAGDADAVEGYVYSIYSPLGFEERASLKKYARKYALRGWHYKSAFYRGSGETEALRRKAMEPLFRLEKGIAQETAYKQIDAVKRFLNECGAEQKLDALRESLGKDARLEQEYFAQVYQKSLETLDGMAQVFGDGRIEPRALSRLLKTAFGNTKIALIPPTTDEVRIYDISVARLPGVEVLFAAGMHDGVWPAKDDGSGLLSRSERETLFEAGLNLGVYDASEEKLKVYTALSKPKKKLYISHNAQTGQPSVLIDRIKRLFPRLSACTQPEYSSIAGAQARVLGAMADVLAGGEPDGRLAGMCSLMLKTPGWRDKARRMLLRTNAAEPVAKEDAVRLYGGIRCSATRIEDYYKCPFKHFLDFGLKAEQERDYTNDRVDIGTYMHLALDMFVKALLEDGADIKELSEADTEARMTAAAMKAAEVHEDGKLKSDERFALRLELLKKELVNTALRIRSHFLGSRARVFLSEQDFSGYAVDTEFGEVEITGKIDRIDVADGYFRVVDYKSSSTGFSLKDFAGGVSIQLPLYIRAAQRLLEAKGEYLKPAGGYYMRIGDAYKSSEREVARDSRLTGLSLRDAEALSALSAVNEDGSFVAIDQALKISGELKSSAKHFDECELRRLTEYTDELIRRAAEGMYSGDNAINPAVGTSGADVCDYCAYGSVCMMDPGYEGNASRQIAEMQSLFLREEGGADDVE
ncbi:MAG: PD-(D/E)XK nuclease family protein [Burkholderiales bacterium]